MRTRTNTTENAKARPRKQPEMLDEQTKLRADIASEKLMKSPNETIDYMLTTVNAYLDGYIACLRAHKNM